MRDLRERGVDVHVAMPAGGPLQPAYEAAGVTVHLVQTSFPTHRPHLVPSTLRAFRTLVADVRPDLIHSHFVGTTLTMRLALGRNHPIPRLFQVPGPLHLEHALFRSIEIRTAGTADRWLGACRWTCDRYRRSGVPEHRVFYSMYGFDIDEYADVAPSPLREELGLGPNTPLAGMVAYMYPPKRFLGQRRGLKGHEDFVDALVVARHRRPDLVGVVVGGSFAHRGGYEERVRRYAAERLGDAVRFLGWRTDVTALYPNFDLAVHPSHSENLGGAAESLLLAVPTVATDVGGFPDVVRDGETGWLVPPKATDALAAAMLAGLDDRAEATRRAAAGRVLARRVLDPRASIDNVLAIYDRVLAQPATAVEG